MTKPESAENDAPAGSAPSEPSSDRDDVTSTSGEPVRKMFEAPPEQPRRPSRFRVAGKKLFPPTEGGAFQRRLRAAWTKLWETEPPVFPLRLGPAGPWPKVQRIVPAFLTSSLLHSAVLFFLYSIPFAALLAWLMGSPPKRAPSQAPVVVVEFRHLDLADYLPAIHPRGRAKAPGRGANPGTNPRLGSSQFDPRITIVSNPPRPDNPRLTLKTENAPPGLQPPIDAKVPDLVAGGPKPAPEAAKSPTPPPEKVDNPKPENPSPAPPSKPLDVQIVMPPMKFAPPPPPPPPQLELAMQMPVIPNPQLVVPPPPPPVKNPGPPGPEVAPHETTHTATAAANNNSENATLGDKANPGGGPQILSLSVDPVKVKDLMSIPAGERAGAFTVSPAGTTTGSPGGVPGGLPDVGEGGHGPGGDRTVAVGNGGKGPPGGGGPGGSASNPFVSISGTAGDAGISSGTLPPLKPEDLVYRVKPEAPRARTPSMLVTSGAGGGGGLRLYGVLHSDRIYTVYLPMPGSSWILQYCSHESAIQVDQASGTAQVHMQPPLTPPAPIEQFDFHRPPEPPDPVNSMIILHGTMHADGSVSDLTVVQGLGPLTNAAAMAAFLHWKFKPALSAGTPATLELLVGIR